MTRTLNSQRIGGFTLIEVLVAMVVVVVALLGFAKMQALGMSNTSLARTRSLAALQTESLAAAMHGNTAFWATGAAPDFTVTPTAVTDAGSLLASPPSDNCPSTRDCSPTELAALDVDTWRRGVAAQFPGFSQAVVKFNNVAGSPVSCRITFVWTENYASATSPSASSVTSATQTYTLYVEP